MCVILDILISQPVIWASAQTLPEVSSAMGDRNFMPGPNWVSYGPSRPVRLNGLPLGTLRRA